MEIIAGYFYAHRTWLNDGVRLDFRLKRDFSLFFFVTWALGELSLGFFVCIS